MRWLGLAILSLSSLLGREILGRVERRVLPRTASGCTAPTSSVQLDINNVRCLIHNGGDMWWDLVRAPRYEIPKVPPGVPAIHSLFAGAIWVGGIDAAGRLRLAAQTYRQSGIDFFAGPLSLEGTTDASTCQQWDKHFVITRDEINRFRAAFQADPSSVNPAKFPNVFNWPGNNPVPGFERQLAPFKDVDLNGLYEPSKGDYPDVPGDMAIWWVYNDKGNVHTETGAAPIGIEIQALAFAFATTNEVNNMTFYQYKIFNRGTLDLQQTYMAVWVDADVGFYADDYVGCDTTRGLGFCYNGDNDDNPPEGYGRNPPAVGTDFFQGPRNELGQRLKMTNFMYYDNDFSVRGNPTNAIHFYNYMRSIWKDGSPLVNNGTNGYGGSGNPTNYIFTGMPGGAAVAANPNCRRYNPPAHGWDERSAGNQPFDRRYLQSAGPFLLRSGAVNEIIIGVPWARDANGSVISPNDGNVGSVCLLLRADDVAQALFDANFQLVDGPDAPDMEIVELDRELVLKWGYKNPFSNNYRENYIQRDPTLVGAQDPYYRFEGFLVYQLRDARVSPGELQNPDRAILIAQCDIRNDVSTIVNREEVFVPGQSEPLIVDKVMVSGKNEGLFYSLRVTEDRFAEGTDNRLINYRKYYFAIVAYAYNGEPSNPVKFIVGRNNVRVYEAMPHKVEFERGGTALRSRYGDGVALRRRYGEGNGGNILALSDRGLDQLFSPPYRADPLEYSPKGAPVAVKVVDPKQLKSYDYRLIINTDTAVRETSLTISGRDTIYLLHVKEWELYGKPRESNAPYRLIYTSWATIPLKEWGNRLARVKFLQDNYLKGTERVIPDHGISIAVRQVLDPGIEGAYLPDRDTTLCPPPIEADYMYYYFLQDVSNGLIDIIVEYEDPTKPWLSAFPRSAFVFTVDGRPDTLGWVEGPGLSPGQSPAKRQSTAGGRVQRYNPGCQLVYKDAWTESRAEPPFPESPDARIPQRPWVWFYDGMSERFYQAAYETGWAPFGLVTPYSDLNSAQIGVGAMYCGGDRCPTAIANYALPATLGVTLKRLPSMQIVITPDPRKWSKCLVLEASPSYSLSRAVGGGFPRMAKWRLSRDILQGDTLAYRSGPLTVSNQGFSWFPGYAVNLETGERVNILFAEASWFQRENGDDMLFNPTSSRGSSGDAYGGRHWVFVTTYPYDGCAKFAEWLCVGNNPPRDRTPGGVYGLIFDKPGGGEGRLDSFFTYVAWVGLPRVAGPQYEFKHYKDIPTEVSITLAVNKSYKRAPTGEPPTFEFSTTEIMPKVGEVQIAKNALDLIRVVPNPYYGRSGVGSGRYEVSQIDTRVKIINLPPRCNVRIFTLNGVLVRTFRKDSEEPDIEWDLKNEYGVPIASGVYIIHVEVPGVGEKVVKFFAIMPQIDLNNY
ncbi:MAG: hypothetical protein NZ958_02300 [Bacteroidia bacterium]|nr:hypothetical protein [Bacteroidia bacterium]MDW8089176.1 hypothetical protein [Bacteroidia bacterium]